jgi:hypothetical protein
MVMKIECDGFSGSRIGRERFSPPYNLFLGLKNVLKEFSPRGVHPSTCQYKIRAIFAEFPIMCE